MPRTLRLLDPPDVPGARPFPRPSDATAAPPGGPVTPDRRGAWERFWDGLLDSLLEEIGHEGEVAR